MNRFEYSEGRLYENETIVIIEKFTKFYNGHEKTNFLEGDLILTTHRLFWGSQEEFEKGSVQLCLRLCLIKSFAEEISSYLFNKKKRLICYLHPISDNFSNGTCNMDFIKISSKHGLSGDFLKFFKSAIENKAWTVVIKADETPKTIKLRTGIVGIERSIITKQNETDKNICNAFKDLDILMKMAQDMVKLSKVIGGKIKEHASDITEDETLKFKIYLMSLGIEGPVTRNNFQSNSEYYTNLAKELTEILLDVVGESDGMISLVESYCRINRARCFEMLSTEDFLTACKYLEGPLKLRTFESGTVILALEYNDDLCIANNIAEKVSNQQYLTIEKYADELKISLLLAKERLLVAESLGKICRDNSIEGLRFYPNNFLI